VTLAGDAEGRTDVSRSWVVVVAVCDVYGSGQRCGIQVAETKHSYKVVASLCGLLIPHAPIFLREGPCHVTSISTVNPLQPANVRLLHAIAVSVSDTAVVVQMAKGWLWRRWAHRETSRAVFKHAWSICPARSLQSGLCGHGGHSGSKVIEFGWRRMFSCGLAVLAYQVLPPSLK